MSDLVFSYPDCPKDYFHEMITDMDTWECVQCEVVWNLNGTNAESTNGGMVVLVEGEWSALTKENNE